jgi:hypothetical protein
VGWIDHLTAIVDEGQVAGEISQDIIATDLASNLVESYYGIQHVSFRACNGTDLPARIHRWWNILLPAIATPGWLTANQQPADA